MAELRDVVRRLKMGHGFERSDAAQGCTAQSFGIFEIYLSLAVGLSRVQSCRQKSRLSKLGAVWKLNPRWYTSWMLIKMRSASGSRRTNRPRLGDGVKLTLTQLRRDTRADPRPGSLLGGDSAPLRQEPLSRGAESYRTSRYESGQGDGSGLRLSGRDLRSGYRPQPARLAVQRQAE